MTAVTSLRQDYRLAGDKDPAPHPEELARRARIHCDGENHERDNAHANCRCEPVEGESESGHAGLNENAAGSAEARIENGRLRIAIGNCRVTAPVAELRK